MKSLLDTAKPPNSGFANETRGQGRDCRVQHQVIDSFEAIGDLQQEWDACVERNGGDLYSTFDWCRIWWRFYGSNRSLIIHLFRLDGDVVAIIPMFRESVRLGPIALQVLRIVGCDHSTTTCGVVVDAKQVTEILDEFSRWLRNDPAWEIMHWGPLAGYFDHLESLARAIGNDSRWTVESSLGEPHILWNLPDSFEGYLSGLHKKERSNIKICRKKLAENTAVVDSGASFGDLEFWFPMFVEQHREQWKAVGKLGHFDDWPRARLFHVEQARAMCESGRLWLLRLRVGEETIGFQYNYRFNRRVHWLLGSRDLDPRFDSFSSGRLLHAETIERAIESQMTTIDGLRGMYEYKLRFGGAVSHVQYMTVIRRGMWIRTKQALFRLISRGLNLLYYRIWFARCAPKLGGSRRGLWERWIRWQFLSQ